MQQVGRDTLTLLHRAPVLRLGRLEGFGPQSIGRVRPQIIERDCTLVNARVCLLQVLRKFVQKLELAALVRDVGLLQLIDAVKATDEVLEIRRLLLPFTERMPLIRILGRSLVDCFENTDLRPFVVLGTRCRQHAQILELGHGANALRDFCVVYKYFLRRQTKPQLLIGLVGRIVLHLLVLRRLTVHLLL